VPTYEEVDVTGPGVAQLVSELATVYDSGGVLLRRFRCTDPDEKDAWFGTNTKLHEYESFRTFLGSAAVRAALPELSVPDPFPISHPPEFPSTAKWWTLMLDGWFALRLMHGGAYGRYAGSAIDAKKIGENAVKDLVQGRHDDFDAFASDEAWTPWFRDIAWDSTLILVDRARYEVTVLCMTDTD
jgi:hypothetical protein